MTMTGTSSEYGPGSEEEVVVPAMVTPSAGQHDPDGSDDTDDVVPADLDGGAGQTGNQPYNPR
jgi:hypothetical protein